MKTIKLKINKVIPGYAIGQTAVVPADDMGTPLSKTWRDRLRDAKIDNCVEIMKPESQKPESKNTETQKSKSSKETTKGTDQ